MSSVLDPVVSRLARGPWRALRLARGLNRQWGAAVLEAARPRVAALPLPALDTLVRRAPRWLEGVELPAPRAALVAVTAAQVGNVPLMRWFHRLARPYALPGRCFDAACAGGSLEAATAVMSWPDWQPGSPPVEECADRLLVWLAGTQPGLADRVFVEAAARNVGTVCLQLDERYPIGPLAAETALHRVAWQADGFPLVRWLVVRYRLSARAARTAFARAVEDDAPAARWLADRLGYTRDDVPDRCRTAGWLTVRKMEAQDRAPIDRSLVILAAMVTFVVIVALRR